ncbi:unnamed protein product [Peronospora farinosa]|uniref:protein-tyrosine-phosphatase n=1 Tax=Peronospora farinosa TaxID=134698 RepID=A0AAV0UBG8_9STRA|nr:unnamed protein product [Peronospora farinosa]CAI5734326.1 unnamed protein product [Peronospora farinosa]
MPQNAQATLNDLQQLKETLSDSERPCSGQDRKRVAALLFDDTEVELSPASVLSQQQFVKKKVKTGEKTSKIRVVKNNDAGDKRVLRRAMSSQKVLTLGHLSPFSMGISPKLLHCHTSKLSISDFKDVSPSSLEPLLPTVYSSKHPDLNVITPETVAEVLRGDYKNKLVQHKLLDCRFPYEFQGGSLTGASLSCDPETMEMQLFMSTAMKRRTRTALIFFCEFSANRAPKMLRHVRNLDRRLNAHCYPELYYPDLYLIDGGYKNCFETLQHEICAPLARYVAMEDKRFAEACCHEFATWRRRWKSHKLVANCAAKLNMPSQAKRHSCCQVRSTPSGVRSLFDEL